MKVSFVLFDWIRRAKSIYSTAGGLGFSTGAFHSGSTFEGEINLTPEQEKELQVAAGRQAHPVFWIRLAVNEKKGEGDSR